MPDWFYRTVSQPVFFRMPPARARGFALGVLGRLARLPLGPGVIDFLGHMRADPRLRRSLLGLDFPSALGLGPWLDAGAVALPALARFGFGWLEIGPVMVEGPSAGSPFELLADRQALRFPDPPAGLGLASAAPRVTEASRLGLPLCVRIGAPPGAGPERSAEEARRIVRELAPQAQAFSLATLQTAMAEDWPAAGWEAHLRAVLGAAQEASPPRPVLLCVPADLAAGEAHSRVEAAGEAGAAGLLVDGSVADGRGGRLIGAPARASALEQTRHWRSRFGDGLPLIVSGGVHEPEDALALRAAGADLVQVDSGVVFTGPGLPKRINETFLFAATRGTPPEPPERAPQRTWFWTALLGAGMLFGSVLALVIAVTRVVLPYDEAFAGMSREELAAVNPRLLHFMAHDRVSLAGTMIAIGVMYLGLSLYGIRQGQHWAQKSVFLSAFTGFASFFLFLGFGYLDPFHAFVTSILMQMLLLGLHSRLGTWVPDVPPPARENAAWRRSLWGQLLLVLHGFGLLGAGATISVIGVSEVFVPQDLEFLRTTSETLLAAHPRLVPLVAHDRATLGGMLLASGWVFLTPVLWGFRNRSGWLWWSLLVAGVSAYAAALGIHFTVGYTSFVHLLPAFGGLGILLLGLGLSYGHLCAGEENRS